MWNDLSSSLCFCRYRKCKSRECTIKFRRVQPNDVHITARCIMLGVYLRDYSPQGTQVPVISQ